MSDQDIGIGLKVTDKTGGKLKKAEKDILGLKSAATSTIPSFSLMSAGLVAAGVGAARATWQLAQTGAQVQQLSDSFNILTRAAGTSSTELLSSLKAASSGTIANSSLMLSANRAMLLGLGADTEKLSNLMEVARFRGRAMGLTTEQAFSDIVTGIGRMSPMILDNLGIVMDADKTYAQYAKTLGVTAGALSDTQKKQALLNQVVQTGQEQIEKAGGIADNAADSFQELGASWQNLKETIGVGLAPMIADLAEAFSDLARAIDEPTESAIRYNRVMMGLSAEAPALPLLMQGMGPQYGPLPTGWVDPHATRAPTYRTGGGAAGRLMGSPQESEQAKEARRNWVYEKGDTSWRSAGADLATGFNSNVSSLKTDIRGLMTGTNVTRLDELETKAGIYKPKWDEPMRRVNDVIQRGEQSPWAQQYFGDASGENLEMKALQFQRDWDTGLYSQLPLSDDDRGMMRQGLARRQVTTTQGEGEKLNFAGEVAGGLEKGMMPEDFTGKMLETVKADIVANQGKIAEAGKTFGDFFWPGMSASPRLAASFIEAVMPGIIAQLQNYNYLTGGG